MRTGRHLGALVLAAGYSSRMGQFKPLLPFGSSTVIGNVIESLRAAGIDDITAVVGHRANELQPLLEDLRVHCVLNPVYGQGMYSSVVAGFRSLPRRVEACFLLPGDMPGVQPDTIRMIAEDYAINRASITYPVLGGRRGHPPLISRALFPAILSTEGAGGLRAVLAGYDSAARNVEVGDQGIHWDLDTPEQYSELSARRPSKELALPGVPYAPIDTGKGNGS